MLAINIFPYIINSPLVELVNYIFRDSSNIYIFGGFIRDYFIFQNCTTAKDIDVVLIDNVPVLLARRKTTLKGYNTIINGINIDFWNIKDTYFFVKNNVRPCVKLLPITTVYDINSVVYDVKNHLLYESGFFKSLRTYTIDFQNISYLKDFEEYQKERLLKIKTKTGFHLSARVAKWFYS